MAGGNDVKNFHSWPASRVLFLIEKQPRETWLIEVETSRKSYIMGYKRHVQENNRKVFLASETEIQQELLASDVGVTIVATVVKVICTRNPYFYSGKESFMW